MLVAKVLTSGHLHILSHGTPSQNQQKLQFDANRGRSDVGSINAITRARSLVRRSGEKIISLSIPKLH
jgi:hypothetical protein